MNITFNQVDQYKENTGVKGSLNAGNQHVEGSKTAKASGSFLWDKNSSVIGNQAYRENGEKTNLLEEASSFHAANNKDFMVVMSNTMSDEDYAKIAENGGKGSGKTAWEAMRAGDATGKAVVDAYVKHIAEGIVNLINIFQPQVIAIGGGISKEGDNLLNPVKECVKDRCYGTLEHAEIVMAKLGNDAGIVGAAFLGK